MLRRALRSGAVRSAGGKHERKTPELGVRSDPPAPLLGLPDRLIPAGVALAGLFVGRSLLPRRIPKRRGRSAALTAHATSHPSHHRWLGWLILPLAALIVTLSSLEFLTLWFRRWRWPSWLSRVREAVMPFRSLNTYGLFAVMTTSRPEIIIEGSNDGHTWLAYEFKWKPGDVRRRPAFTGLHMPRLDWQMWFAALGHIGQNSWLLYFLVRLLEGSPEVLGLLHHNPFPDAPPRYVRAVLYDYRFSDRSTRKKTGAWWQRKALGFYCPILALARNELGWY
jgi:hypothetical protein